LAARALARVSVWPAAMADKTALVQQVKDWQRQGDGYKQCWYNFVKERDSSGTFDPNRHDEALLEEFLTAAHSGELEIPSGCSSGGSKGWGGGGGSWGGKGWGGDDAWGGGKGCGKWGMTPWDMMGMMQQMWAWAGSKGLMDKGMGKGDSQKKGSTELGGQSKPGDWVCPQCQNINFSNRETCNKCGFNGRGQKRLGMKPGDWICPGCGDLVFASKSQCKMCGNPKPDDLDESSTYNANSYSAAYGKGNNQNMKPGDWICPNPACGDLVFASRSACKLCGTEKPNEGGFGSSRSRYSPY